MSNPQIINTLLINGPTEILALSALWLELSRQNWRFSGLNSDPGLKKLFHELGRQNKKFYPLPQASSKIKIILIIILWPFWFLFYLIIFAYYKYRKKTNLIIAFNIPDLIFLSPISRILGIYLNVLLGPRSIARLADLKAIKLFKIAAKKHRLLVVSEESKKRLANLGFQNNNIKIISPGIKTKAWQHQADIFSSLAAADKRRSHKKFFSIGTAVNLNKQQNIELLFQAAKKCLTIIPQLQILIIGDGPERKNLAWLAKKLNISNLVWFVGDQKFLKKWLDNMDVYINTCSLAGINDIINTLYAAASSLPIIGARDSGLNGIIIDNENGLMIKKNNSEDLAQAIISLYKDKGSRQRLGQNAQKMLEQKFLLEHMLGTFNSLKNYKIKIK